jgi:hypothetical protein
MALESLAYGARMHGCRYIEGDAQDVRTRGDDIYCNKPLAVPGGSWCREHLARIVIKVGAEKRQALEQR